MTTAAIFLDRDGTVIEDIGYIAQPGDVKLTRGCVEALSKFCAAGYQLVIVSNQSGVARGMFDESAVQQINRALEDLLSGQGIKLAGVYYCPFLAEGSEQQYKKDSDLRKPSPGMLLQAAQELDIDLSVSWMIGDTAEDVQAGKAAGCKTILLARPEDSGQLSGDADIQVADLSQAAQKILHPPQAGTASDQPRRAGSLGKSLVNMEKLMREIRSQLRQSNRLTQQADFSVHKMVGALVQILVLAILFWTAIKSIDMGQVTAPTSVHLTLMVAIVLQLLALTFFFLDRQR